MTTTPDFPDLRALCTELAVDLEEWMVATDHRPASSVKLVDRARAALATPPPEPPPLKLKRSGCYQPLAQSTKTNPPPSNP
jgi:hypothetical protein